MVSIEEKTLTVHPRNRWPNLCATAFRAQWLGLLMLTLFPLTSRIAFAADAPPAQEAYRLQAGDQIAVTVRPQEAYDSGGVILKDGAVSLKGAGLVRAAGFTSSELAEVVRRALSDRLVSPRVTVAIVKLHPTPAVMPGMVSVVGAVTSAGGVKLTPGMRLYEALESAGFDPKHADLKRLSLMRLDLTRVVLDLSTPSRVSDPAQNVLLQDGDSIEVPAIPLRTINVLGAVNKPGAQEFEEGLRLHKALEVAGGHVPGADLSRVSVRHADLTRSEADLSSPEKVADSASNPALSPGDTVEVPLRTAADARVRIRGEVLNAGRFPYRPEMTLDDLIVAAGKLTPLADIEHVQLQRPGEPVQVLNLLQLKQLGLKGNVPLQPEDELFVPEQKDTILLLGAVPRPGRIAIKAGQTLLGFFTQGDADSAAALDPQRAELTAVQLIRRGQAPRKVNVAEALLKPARKKEEFTLESGDVVFFPPRQPKGAKKGPLELLSSLGPLALLFGF